MFGLSWPGASHAAKLSFTKLLNFGHNDQFKNPSSPFSLPKKSGQVLIKVGTSVNIESF